MLSQVNWGRSRLLGTPRRLLHRSRLGTHPLGEERDSTIELLQDICKKLSRRGPEFRQDGVQGGRVAHLVADERGEGRSKDGSGNVHL
jgi:hypothetical protein